ncbi:MAG: adenylate/guanylate cyclase domain-containing protein [Thiolinea sp.]
MFLNNISLKSKLVFMLLSIAIGCILIVGYQGLSNGEKALKSRIYEQLTSVRETRGHQVETWYRDIKSQLHAVANNHTTIYALREFRDAFNKLAEKTPEIGDEKNILDKFYTDKFFPGLNTTEGNEPQLKHYLPSHAVSRYLQLEYIAKNPQPDGKRHEFRSAGNKNYYDAVHAHYHPLFKDVMSSNHFYDLFLIDIDSGDIVYSVAKEVDYATSLKSGPYRNSNFGQLYQKIVRSQNFGETLSADFDFYQPSYGQPGMFIGTTIFDFNQRPVGILAIQVHISHLDDIMTGNKGWKEQGLGETGETFLVGDDRLMRSNARRLFSTANNAQGCYATALHKKMLMDEATADSICKFQTSILFQEVSGAYIDEALNGRSGTTVATAYTGDEALVAYKPVYLGNMKWAVVSQLDSSEANTPIRDFQKELGISAILIACAVTFIAMLLAALFISPLNKLMAGVRKLGSSTDDLHIDLNRNDEYGELAKAMNKAGDVIRQQSGWLEAKEAENNRLLLNILPEKAARRFISGKTDFVERIDNATIAHIGIKGLSRYVNQNQSADAIRLFNALTAQMDELAARYEVEKIKMMGDSYLVTCGVNVSRLDHARRSVMFGRALLDMLPQFNQQHQTNFSLQIGVHCGALLAGITVRDGDRDFSYHLWGDAVQVADYLRCRAAENSLLISREVYRRLDHTDDFSGPVLHSISGAGDIEVFTRSRASGVAKKPDAPDTQVVDSDVVMQRVVA